MNKRVISLLLVIVSIVATIRTLSSRQTSSSVVVDELELEMVSINSLIDNDMNIFEQTAVFDRDIESFMRRWELKGATFALMRNDSLLYTKGYGYASDVERCEANNLFRIASVSKLLTATAIMKLVEGGSLSLETQVFGREGILCDSMFLNLYSKSLEQITVEHLLRHTAGFSSPHGDPAFSNYSIARQLGKELPLTTDDMVLYATRNRLRCRPGECYRYSNLGYMILGKIVERVSGVDYEAFVRDSILAPVGCYDMYIGQNFSVDRAPNEVQYYEVKEAEPVEAYDGSGMLTMKSNGGNNVTLLSGAGGWVSSSSELLRFIASINGCSVKADILSAESLASMVDDESRRPIGWASTNGGVWLRSGSMAGTSALVKRQSDGYTWVFISNSSAWIGHRLSSYISSYITKSIAKVSRWPSRDLFEIEVELKTETPLELD